MPPHAGLILGASASFDVGTVLPSVIVAIVSGVILAMIKRSLDRQDEISTKLDAHGLSLALLTQGDEDDDREIKKMRRRLHRIENRLTFMLGRLEVAGIIQNARLPELDELDDADDLDDIR